MISGATFQTSVFVDVVKSGAPAGLVHAVANPNPFNPETAISFQIAQPGSVKLTVYDVNGRLVKTLTNGVMGSGLHEVRWNGTTETGARVSSGVYYYVLKTPEGMVKNQIILAR